MRPAEVARRGAAYLARHGVASADHDAEALLRQILGVDRATLHARADGLTPAQARAFGRALCRRCTGTPLQHLTGEQGFRHLVLRVRPGVFVPRPETEVLVDVALARLADTTEPVVADACTGTGAVALAIADEHPGARVVATDLSPEAVALARENAVSLGLVIEVLEGDLLAPIEGPLDLVTCNPPYVPETARGGLPAEVLADPPLAIFERPGLYERLFVQAFERLRPGGSVVVEIEEAAAATVVAAAEAAGFTDVVVLTDLADRDRVVGGRRP
jgi:release factor glutamine methyltransferase